MSLGPSAHAWHASRALGNQAVGADACFSDASCQASQPRERWLIVLRFYEALHWLNGAMKDKGYTWDGTRHHLAEQSLFNLAKLRLVDAKVHTEYVRLHAMSNKARYSPGVVTFGPKFGSAYEEATARLASILSYEPMKSFIASHPSPPVTPT